MFADNPVNHRQHHHLTCGIWNVDGARGATRQHRWMRSITSSIFQHVFLDVFNKAHNFQFRFSNEISADFVNSAILISVLVSHLFTQPSPQPECFHCEKASGENGKKNPSDFGLNNSIYHFTFYFHRKNISIFHIKKFQFTLNVVLGLCVCLPFTRLIS